MTQTQFDVVVLRLRSVSRAAPMTGAPAGRIAGRRWAMDEAAPGPLEAIATAAGPDDLEWEFWREHPGADDDWAAGFIAGAGEVWDQVRDYLG